MAKRPSVVDPPAPAPAANTRHVNLDLTPSPEAGEALSLRNRAAAIVVVDQDSHRNALEFMRGAKQVRKRIVDHWSRIKRAVDEMKRSLLDLERQDLEPVDAAIALVEPEAINWKNAEDRRAQEETDRRRREAEARAREDREKLLADQEREALRLEQDSPNLSNREQIFVEAVALYPVGVSHNVSTAAANRAGYKDPAGAAQRLLATSKIMDAILAKRQARELREQAAATKQQPLDVATQKPVKANTARVAGVSQRTYYSCHPDVDVNRLLDAIAAGTVARNAVKPDLVELNRAADDLKGAFEAGYPGCRLVKRQGIAG